jgi:hypothetical protein
MAMVAGLVPMGLWCCGLLYLMVVWYFHGMGYEVFLVAPTGLLAYVIAFFVSGGAFLWADRRGISNEAGLSMLTRRLMRVVLVALIAPWILVAIVSIIWGAK